MTAENELNKLSKDMFFDACSGVLLPGMQSKMVMMPASRFHGR